MSPQSVMEGIEMETKRGYVLVYPASVLVAMSNIDVDGWAYRVKEDDKWNKKGDRIVVKPVELLQATNFYCNGSGVDRVMWAGYTRAGAYI